MATRSKMGGSIQGCADAAGNPEGWPVPVTNLAGQSLNVNIMGGGGGAVTIADGADVAEGSTTDTAVNGDTPGTISAKLRGINRILTDVWDDIGSALFVEVINSVPVTQGTSPWVVSGTVTANQGTSPWVISGTVDTELPAPAALADATANPTVPGVGAFSLGFNGSTWDRLKTANGAAGTAGTGLLGSGLLGFDGANWQSIGANNTGSGWLQVGQRAAGPSLADGATNAPTVAANGAGTALSSQVYPLHFNGTTWDRTRSANSVSGTTGTGLQAAGMMLYDGTNWQRAAADGGNRLQVSQKSASTALADAVSNTRVLPNDTAGTSQIDVREFPFIFNGTTWDRERAANSAAATSGTGLLGVGILGFDGANYQRAAVTTNGDVFTSIRSANNALADAISNTVQQPVNNAGSAVGYRTFPLAYNETTWDRPRNNTDVTGLASAARTTTQTITGVNYNGRGISVVVDMTAIGAGATWTVTIDMQDAVSGKFVNLLTGAAIAGNGTTMYRVYPGLTAVANVDANAFVPRNYRVVITVGGTAASSTFSAGIQTVQ